MAIENTTIKSRAIGAVTLLIVTLLITGTLTVTKPAQQASGVYAVHTSAGTSSPIASSTTAFKDGTYSAQGTYRTPGGSDSIKVSVQLVAGTITSATVTPEADDPTCLSYQQLFAQGFTPHVVGQKIARVHLSNISGSSLTPQGFNDALRQIESDARA